MQALSRLVAFVTAHPGLLVLTGAGVSTESGIPDYRDRQGQWKRNPPVQYDAFMGSLAVRQRYWARALAGFDALRRAQPGAAHRVLAAMEAAGWVQGLITQNVDRLHQKAGSQGVIDLHGRADTVSCQSCGHRLMRYAYHQQLALANPDFAGQQARVAPDGDADLEHLDFHCFQVLDCSRCGGLIKPDVVFFGERIPQSTRATAEQWLVQADALLVVGSSLMVHSGYRFCQWMQRAGKPVAALNLGRTRADDLLALKVEAPVGPALLALSARLAAGHGRSPGPLEIETTQLAGHVQHFTDETHLLQAVHGKMT